MPGSLSGRQSFKYSRGRATGFGPPSSPRRTSRGRLLGWVSEHTLAALTLIGLVAYGVIQLAYVQFYGRLGVDPDEVGFDYVHTLSQSVPTVAVIIASYTVLAGFAVFALYLLLDGLQRVARRYRRRTGEPEARQSLADSWLSRVGTDVPLRAWAVILVALGVAAAAASVYYALGALAEKVERGEAVHATRLGQAEGLNPLSFSAEPVELVSVSSEETPIARLAGHRLMYLGGSGGIYVLYDSSCKRVIRLPAAEVLMVQPDPEEVQEPKRHGAECSSLYLPLK